MFCASALLIVQSIYVYVVMVYHTIATNPV